MQAMACHLGVRVAHSVLFLRAATPHGVGPRLRGGHRHFVTALPPRGHPPFFHFFLKERPHSTRDPISPSGKWPRAVRPESARRTEEPAAGTPVQCRGSGEARERSGEAREGSGTPKCSNRSRSVVSRVRVEAPLLQIGFFTRSRIVVRICWVCPKLFLFTTLIIIYLLNTHTHIYIYLYPLPPSTPPDPTGVICNTEKSVVSVVRQVQAGLSVLHLTTL